jgi:hypothetical protein
MPSVIEMAGARSLPAGSARLRLAALASDAALAVPGVVRLTSGTGGTFVTSGSGERVEGVLCTSGASDAYDVSLRIVCAVVPLQRLGESVIAAVRRAAAIHGLPLGFVSVDVWDLETGGA